MSNSNIMKFKVISHQPQFLVVSNPIICRTVGFVFYIINEIKRFD